MAAAVRAAASVDAGQRLTTRVGSCAKLIHVLQIGRVEKHCVEGRAGDDEVTRAEKVREVVLKRVGGGQHEGQAQGEAEAGAVDALEQSMDDRVGAVGGRCDGHRIIRAAAARVVDMACSGFGGFGGRQPVRLLRTCRCLVVVHRVSRVRCRCDVKGERRLATRIRIVLEATVSGQVLAVFPIGEDVT